MQTQSQSDHILDVLHTGSGRVQKMQQNTQAMVDQYQALLQNIVSSGSLQDPKTGTPFLPSNDFLSAVKKQFDLLKEDLKEERDTNQDIITNALGHINNCSSARETSFVGVLQLAGTMRTLRDTHETCRTGENTAIASMEDECKKFDAISDKCSDNQDWYAAFDDPSIKVEEHGNTLASVTSQAVVCADKVDAATTKAQECDQAQGNFKDGYCAYEKSLTEVCKTYNECYDSQKENYETSKASVDSLEKEQKTIWAMVGKVECYLQVMTDAVVTNMPTQADITGCQQLQPDTSKLTIDYGTVPNKDKCATNSALGSDPRDLASPQLRPGLASWFDGEFSGDTFQLHDKMGENTACAR